MFTNTDTSTRESTRMKGTKAAVNSGGLSSHKLAGFKTSYEYNTLSEKTKALSLLLVELES